MLISIITVCYNSEKTIDQTIKSLLAQSFSDFEYILIDGKSTDRTLSIIKSFKKSFAKKSIPYHYISEPDSGIYEAMNKGIKLAQGKLIGIINSDDWYENNALDIAAREYANNKESVNYGMLNIYKNEKLYCIRQFTHDFINETMFQHPTWFVPKAIYERCGMFDTQYKIAADYEFANRLMKAKVSFNRIEEKIANFRLGGTSHSSAKIGAIEIAKIKFLYGFIDEKGYLNSTKNYSNNQNIIKYSTLEKIIRKVCYKAISMCKGKAT